MKKRKQDNVALDAEEIDLLHSFEKGEWKTVSDKEKDLPKINPYTGESDESDRH